jgi:hypothetical protein
MPDRSGAKDPGAIWREQPKEELAVNLDQIMNRRTESLYSSTRSEILLSIGAALLFVGIMAMRFAPAHDRLLETGLAAIIAWAGITLYRFRNVILRRDSPRPDATAATGVEYYRRELERRRDHLRNAWVWHGPLLLACVFLTITLTFPNFGRLLNVLPIVAVLVVWTGFGLRRRHRLARELQREIDELEPRGAKERSKK